MVSKQKGGVAIICGSAPCVKQEFDIVNKARPDATVVGINDTVSIIKCDMLMTYHIEEVERFLEKSLSGNLEIHTSRAPRPEIKNLANKFWTVKGGATSAIDAVQICQQMGFDEIILVGCPMTGGDGYFFGKAKENVDGCPRFGNPGNEFLARKHQIKLVDIVRQGGFDNVFSMSGFTAEILGKPIL